MNIQGVHSWSLRPLPATQQKKPLAQDVLDSGAEVTVPRWLKLFGRRAASAEDIQKQLAKAEPDLQVHLPDADLPCALKSQEDLTQLAVFQGLLPASVLPQPALAEALLDLREAGWAFQSGQQSISALQAYQELPAGRVTGLYHSHKLALDLAGVGALAAFYKASDLLHYDAFDARGEPCLPHLATSLGKQEPWLPVERSAELTDFERFQPEKGDLQLTRQVYDAKPHELPALLKEAQPEDYERVLPPALEKIALSGPELVQIARDLPPHQAWLDKLKDDPEVGQAARITARNLNRESWPHFLENSTQDALAFSSSLLEKTPSNQVALEVLRALQQDPETRPAARALEHWQPADLAQATRKLLVNPRLSEKELDQLGLELCRGDNKREARLLESRAERGIPAARMAATLYPRLQSYDARRRVLEAGMGSAHGVRLYRPLLENLRDQKDASLIAEQARQDLAGLPVMAAINRWGHHEALLAVKLAVENEGLKTPAELHRLGVSQCSAYNQTFCQLLLQEQKALGPEQARAAEIGLELMGELKSSTTRQKLWELCTRSTAQAQDREQVYATLLRDVDRSRADQDAQLLAGKLRPMLASTPVLQALDRWQLGLDEPALIQLAVDNRNLTDAKDIHRFGVSRVSLYQMDQCMKLLQEQEAFGGDQAQAARTARELLPQLKSRRAKEKLWKLATTAVVDPMKLYPAILDDLRGNSSEYQREAQQADQNLVAARLRPHLQSHPLLQALDRWPLGYDEAGKMAHVLENLRVSTPEEVHQVGIQLTSTYNSAMCEAILKDQEAFGAERAEAARLALELMPQLKSRRVREKAFELATRQAALVKDPLQAYSWLLNASEQESDYQREQIQKDHELLAGRMRPLLAGNPVLAALDRWPSGLDEVGRIRKTLDNPRARTAAEVHAVGVSLCSHYNTAMTTALLEEQVAAGGREGQAAALALELGRLVKSHIAREKIWEMATKRPELAGKPLELYASLIDHLQESSSSYQSDQKQTDALALAGRARPLLAGNRVLEALDRWNYSDETRRIQAVLKNPQADPLALGEKLCSDHDFALQTRLLAEKGAPNAQLAMKLIGSCQASASKTALYKQGMKQQSLPEFYARSLDAITSLSSNWQADQRQRDAQILAEQALQDLPGEAARLARAWQPADKVRAARSVLTCPELRGAELERWLALAICPPGDQALQDRTLAAQGTDLARLTQSLRGQVQSEGARYALWRGAVEQPELGDAEAARKFAKNVLKHYDEHWSRKPKERETLEKLLETYLSVVTLVARPAPTGVVEEGERVLVGGVVVRKKEISA
ncbi:MAG: hypothetical protein AMXMBFR33_46350 [Candidatus Xenobia bacterium]